MLVSIRGKKSMNMVSNGLFMCIEDLNQPWYDVLKDE